MLYPSQEPNPPPRYTASSRSTLQFAVPLRRILLAVLFYLEVSRQFAVADPEAGGSVQENQFHEADGDIRIVGGVGGKPQILPAMYANSLQRWVLTSSSTTSSSSPSSSAYKLISIPSVAEEFVAPTSTTHLWWPSDLPTLQARPSLDVIVQNGQLKYVCGGVDVRALLPSSKFSSEESLEEDNCRNHGLHSAPIARQWLPFSVTSLPTFRVEAFFANTKDDEEVLQWKEVVPDTTKERSTKATRMALEQFGLYWAEAAATTEESMANGFHVVSIPLPGMDWWFALPIPHQNYLLASLATAVPVTELKDALFRPPTTTTSILAVEVVQTAPGGDSDHLPDAYKPFYSRITQ